VHRRGIPENQDYLGVGLEKLDPTLRRVGEKSLNVESGLAELE